MSIPARILAAFALSVAVAAIVASPASARMVGANASAKSTATIDVTYADGTVEIVSSKGISHYILTDCEGNVFKQDLEGPELRTLLLTPDATIAQVVVKSGTTTSTFDTSDACDDTPDEEECLKGEGKIYDVHGELVCWEP
jgi:hypothetical protein